MFSGFKVRRKMDTYSTLMVLLLRAAKEDEAFNAKHFFDLEIEVCRNKTWVQQDILILLLTYIEYASLKYPDLSLVVCLSTKHM